MAEILLVVWGTIQALAFAYIPGLKDWYENKLAADKPEDVRTTYKRGVQALGILIVAAILFGLSCVGVAIEETVCTYDGALAMLLAYVTALGANQGAYWLAPQTKKRVS